MFSLNLELTQTVDQQSALRAGSINRASPRSLELGPFSFTEYLVMTYNSLLGKTNFSLLWNN